MERYFYQMGELFFRFRLGRAIGLALFLAGLIKYRSYENRPVLGFWSYPFLIMIIAAAALLLAAIVSSWRAQRRLPQPSTPHRLRRNCLDLGVLCWGLGYWLSAVDAPDSGGRITDLNFFGSVLPAAAFFEWGALVCLTSAIATFWTPRHEGKWANGVLVIWTIVFLLLAGEGVYRSVAMVAPASKGYPTYSSTLWERRYVQLNENGFRDVEHAITKDKHTHRLLIVGDSYAYGWGIAQSKDRFGEQLANRLKQRTGENWESINGSRPDTHTLDHIKFLKSVLAYRPDVIILLYVFNDIDYMHAVTHRQGAVEIPVQAPRSVLDRVHPIRIFYKNSYLFQEAYVHFRPFYYRLYGGQVNDPYANSSLLFPHLNDISRFVTTAAQAGALVRVVPFDVATTANADVSRRYEDFVNRAVAFGIPVWSISQAFTGYDFNQLTVNKLDRHPNELANRLAADLVIERALLDLSKQRKEVSTPAEPRNL